MTQRLFIGVALDEDVRHALEQATLPQGVARPEPAGLRWLSPASWHFTLQFLGAVADELLAAVREACRQAAGAVGSFEIEPGAPGAFASPRRAGVLCIGLAQGSEHLAALAAAVRSATEPLGFTPETREFSAHITVARLKRPTTVVALLETMRVPALRMRVTELTLFRSHLSQHGSRYEALAVYPLTGDTPATGPVPKGSRET
jgi:2'-5' RNA ligase